MGIKSFSELITKLSQHPDIAGTLKKNLLSGNIEFSRKCSWSNKEEGMAITDEDIVNLKYFISESLNQDIPIQKLNEIILILSGRLAYHPIKDYLKTLEWDGVPRLDRWLIEICGTEDNPYYREVGRKILCGAAHRVRRPGAKFDYMMILEGKQGMGKSTLLNSIGGKWYLDTHLSTSENKKDVVDVIRTAWIVEISDLAGFRKHDVEYLKSFISRQVDRVRMPYAHRAEDFPRQCVFIGTHNPSGDNQYFRDDTGNRRFWPVKCGKIDLRKAREWRDQLWAEAVEIEPGQNLYLEDQESLDILSGMHKEREFDVPFNMLIEKYIMGKNVVSNIEIMEKVFHIDPGKLIYKEMISKCTTIGVCMRRIGWTKGENQKRGWYFKPGCEHLEVTTRQELLQGYRE